jgi:hypothetical protein
LLAPRDVRAQAKLKAMAAGAGIARHELTSLSVVGNAINFCWQNRLASLECGSSRNRRR